MSFESIKNVERMSSVLFVDDDPGMIIYYVATFGNKYRVLTATSGSTALAIDLNRIDLAVVDYKLPDMSGVEVIKEIKRIKPSIPIIFVTAYGDEDLVVRSFRAGTKDYVRKPFSYQELQKKIDFYLSLKKESGSERKAIPFIEDLKISNSKLSDSANPCKVQKAVKFINENYMTKISLGTVACKADMSKFHFSREFKKKTGVCYQNYLNQVRIEKAKELIQKEKMSIAKAAYFVGYNDVTYFGRMFKKLSGQTPTQYMRVLTGTSDLSAIPALFPDSHGEQDQVQEAETWAL